MRQWFVVLAGLVTMAAGAPSAHAQCMQAMTQTRAEGRLTVGRFADAAGRPETAYILQTSASVCLDDAEDEDATKGTRKVQIFSPDASLARQIQGLVGRNVVVFGQPFGAHTAHHHAPIVMTVSEIGPR